MSTLPFAGNRLMHALSFCDVIDDFCFRWLKAKPVKICVKTTFQNLINLYSRIHVKYFESMHSLARWSLCPRGALIMNNVTIVKNHQHRHHRCRRHQHYQQQQPNGNH